MRLRYLSHRRPVKAQASLHIRAVLLEPSVFAHMKYGSSWRVRPKNQTSNPTGWLCMRIWRMSLQRTKHTIISWDGSIDLPVQYYGRYDLPVELQEEVSEALAKDQRSEWLDNDVAFIALEKFVLKWWGNDCPTSWHQKRASVSHFLSFTFKSKQIPLRLCDHICTMTQQSLQNGMIVCPVRTQISLHADLCNLTLISVSTVCSVRSQGPKVPWHWPDYADV